jgi:hypothetical protein
VAAAMAGASVESIPEEGPPNAGQMRSVAAAALGFILTRQADDDSEAVVGDMMFKEIQEQLHVSAALSFTPKP